MKTKEILEEIKRIKRIKTDSELAKLLGVYQSHINRLKNNRFYPSTHKMLSILISEYNELEEKYNKLKITLDTV